MGSEQGYDELDVMGSRGWDRSRTMMRSRDGITWMGSEQGDAELDWRWVWEGR
jgi:hypothetical protein